MIERVIAEKESKEIEIEDQPEEPKPEDTKTEEQEFDINEFNQKMQLVTGIISALTGGDTISGRIYPILDPKQWKTTTNLTRGEIEMMVSLITFSKVSPEECQPALDFCLEYGLLKLSESGFGIEKAIDLGKALTEQSSGGTYTTEPDKPTKGMKQKE